MVLPNLTSVVFSQIRSEYYHNPQVSIRSHLPRVFIIGLPQFRQHRRSHTAHLPRGLRQSTAAELAPGHSNNLDSHPHSRPRRTHLGPVGPVLHHRSAAGHHRPHHADIYVGNDPLLAHQEPIPHRQHQLSPGGTRVRPHFVVHQLDRCHLGHPRIVHCGHHSLLHCGQRVLGVHECVEFRRNRKYIEKSMCI